MQMNWLPQYTEADILGILQTEKKMCSRRTAFKNVPNGLLPSRLWQKLVSASGIRDDKSWAEISNKALRSLADQILQGEFFIQGKGVFKEEFVTCGGISLKEVNFKTMESRICSKFFFAGEILDIDGLTGGFNFQAAWTTGWLAGKAMEEGFKPTP